MQRQPSDDVYPLAFLACAVLFVALFVVVAFASAEACSLNASDGYADLVAWMGGIGGASD